MGINTKEDTCIHDLSVNLRSGVDVVNVKPLFSHDTQNIIIACGIDIKVFAIKSGECIQTLRYHTRSVVSLQESKRNILQILSCAENGVIVRWDYTGVILQVYNLQMPVINLYVPSPNGDWFVTKQFEDQYRLYSVLPKKKEGSKVRLILKDVLPDDNSIGFGLMGKYVASIKENNLVIYKCDTKDLMRHKTGDRKLTCVVWHPTDSILATGDEHGRVIIWSNAVESNHPIRSIYHWHTLPVADLAFSPEGSYIYSGGGEAALLKWNLFAEDRAILPRLGAAIKHVVPSRDNCYVLTTHTDNGLQVIDAQRKIVRVIQGLTRSEPLYGKTLPVGLLYNSHLKTLVINGKPGHLQFYDIKQEKQLYNLDIAAKNFLSQQKDIAVYNIDVQKAAFDDSGLWLATTEFWCNADIEPRIWLKFWKFDFEKQTFTLNTNVLMPHNKELNCILLRPFCKEFDDLPLAVTTSQDSRFKIWTLAENERDGKQSWDFEHMGYYKDLTPGDASFSEDGSVLAVAFGSVATLWNVEGLSFRERLFSPKMKEDIQQLLFGRHSSFKYLLGHDGYSITAWDCLTLAVSWIVHVEVQLLARDDITGNIAAFCKNENLKIFKPENPRPLDCVEKVSSSKVVSAIFVPSANASNTSGCFQEKSQLFFIDEAQNLYTLSQPEMEEQVTTFEQETMVQNLKETPFGMLQAAKTISDIKKVETEQFDVNKDLEESDIISNPTWQNIDALFHALIPKLLIPREKSKEEEPNLGAMSAVTPQETIDSVEDSLSTLGIDWKKNASKTIEPKFLDLSEMAKMIKLLD